MRPARPWVFALAAIAVVLAGCSKGDSSATGSASPSTTASTSALAGTSTTATTSPSPSTARPGPTTTAAPAAATTTTALAGGPAVVSAGGWRMAITQPLAGATVGSTPLLCYELTGSSREPVLALEVTLLRAGSPTGAAGPYRLDVSVGRGSVRLSLDGVAPGRYDVRIQLVLNGSPVDGGAVTVPSVTVTAAQTVTASCL